jgi:large subunit ribosomal protein L17
MRHKKAGRKFSRTPAHRKAMFRSMLTSLFRHEKIMTTDAKARELKRLADQMITLGKKGGLHAIRAVATVINDPEVVRKVFKEIAPRFTERKGGYTRAVKVGQRRGDGAEVTIVEILEGTKVAAKKEAREPKAKAKKAPAKKADEKDEAKE